MRWAHQTLLWSTELSSNKQNAFTPAIGIYFLTLFLLLTRPPSKTSFLHQIARASHVSSLVSHARSLLPGLTRAALEVGCVLRCRVNNNDARTFSPAEFKKLAASRFFSNRGFARAVGCPILPNTASILQPHLTSPSGLQEDSAESRAQC